MKHKPTPLLDKIEKVINDTPGLTGAEISELLEGKHVANELLRLVQRGRLTRTPKGKTYIYSPATPDFKNTADMIMVEPADEPQKPTETPVKANPVTGIKRIEVDGHKLIRAKDPTEYCNLDLLALYKAVVNELMNRGYQVGNPDIIFHKVIKFDRI